MPHFQDNLVYHLSIMKNYAKLKKRLLFSEAAPFLLPVIKGGGRERKREKKGHNAGQHTHPPTHSCLAGSFATALLPGLKVSHIVVDLVNHLMVGLQLVQIHWNKGTKY